MATKAKPSTEKIGGIENAGLTEQQHKWFTSVRKGLVRDTGKTLEQWTELEKRLRAAFDAS